MMNLKGFMFANRPWSWPEFDVAEANGTPLSTSQTERFKPSHAEAEPEGSALCGIPWPHVHDSANPYATSRDLLGGDAANEPRTSWVPSREQRQALKESLFGTEFKEPDGLESRFLCRACAELVRAAARV